MTRQLSIIEVDFDEVNVTHPLFSNCRSTLTNIVELADSIKDNGLMQPIVVWLDGGVPYLVAGRRRYEAIRTIRNEDSDAFSTLLVAVADGITAEEAFAKNLEENIQRETLNPADEALAVTRLYERVNNQARVGEMLGKSQPWVSQRISLINNLIPRALEALRTNLINFTAAKAVARLLTEDGAPDAPRQHEALENLLGEQETTRSLVQRTRTFRSRSEIANLKEMLEEANEEMTEGQAFRNAVIRTIEWLNMEVDTSDMIHDTTSIVSNASGELELV